MNHSVMWRRQALHQTHHHYYLNISVEAANLSDWRIKSKLFCPNWNALLCSWWRLLIIYGIRRILQIIDHDANYKSHCWWGLYCLQFTIFAHWEMTLKMPNVSTVKTRWNHEILYRLSKILWIIAELSLYTSKKCTYNYIESVDYKTTINDGLRIKFTRLLQQQQQGG